MSASGWSSTAWWTDLRGSSQHRNTQSSPSVLKTLLCVIFCLSSNAEFSSATRQGGGARATRLPDLRAPMLQRFHLELPILGGREVVVFGGRNPHPYRC